MKKQIIHTALFLTGLVILLAVSSYLTMPKGKDKHVYSVINVHEKLGDLAMEKNNSLDVVILGDSESYSAFYPLSIYKEQGITSYVCGTSLQRLCDSYAILKQVFETQSPKLVIVESDSFFRFGGAYQSNDDKIMAAFEQLLPVLKYHTRWKSYIRGTVKDGQSKHDFKGFKYRTAIVPYTGGPWMIETSFSEDLGYMVEDYLEKINELVERNGAKMLIVSVPSPANWTYEKHNATVLLADRLGVDYLDMNIDSNIQHLDLNWQLDTLDAGNHLNYDGAIKFTKYVAKYIAENYSLDDHRGHSLYHSWDEAVIESEKR